MTIINVMVDDQRLEFSSMPVVASEGVKETYVKFALSSDWSGFGATALFYRDDSPEDVYISVLDGAGLAEVPYEITAAPGWIRFGLSGSDGTSVHTSEILKYKIVKGKYTSGQSSKPPAPGIYEQMLAIAGQMRDTLNASVIEQNAIIQDLVTDMDDLRSDMETEQTTFESVVTGQINTLVNNFAGSSRETILFEGSHTVNIGDEIDLVSDPTVYDYLDIVLNDGMVGTIIGPTQNSQWRVTGETVKSTGTSVTTYVIEGVLDAQSLCLRVSTACAIVDTGTSSTRYDLGSGPIADESLRRYCLKVIGRKLTDDAEVLNIRVGADGVTYQTAGTAVRSQLDKKLNAPISGGTVDYGTSGQLLATDGQGNTEWVDSVIPDGSITLAKLAPGVIDTTYQIQGAAASSVTVGQSLASKANAADVTALDTRVTAVEGDIGETNERLDDAEEELSTIKPIVTEEVASTNVFTPISARIYPDSGTAVINEDKSITITNVPRLSNVWIFAQGETAITLEAGDYTLCFDEGLFSYGNNTITLQVKIGTSAYTDIVTAGGEQTAFTLDTDVTGLFRVQYVASTTGYVTNWSGHIWINKGEAQEYMPVGAREILPKEFVDANQGEENSGKLLSVNDNGKVSLIDNPLGSVVSDEVYQKGNLLKWDEVTKGYIKADGSVQTYNSLWCSDFCEVEQGNIYCNAVSGSININQYFAFYDENKTFLASYQTIGSMQRLTSDIRYLSVPEDAKYFRCTFSVDQAVNRTAWISNSPENPYENDSYNVKDVYPYVVNPENPCDYSELTVRAFSKVVCIGDSLTYGGFNLSNSGSATGETQSSAELALRYSYPSNFQRITGVETVNAGDSGETSVSWYQQHQNDDFSQFDLAIIHLGVNDSAFSVSDADTLTAMQNIVTMLNNARSDMRIAICSVIPAYDGTGYQAKGQLILNWAKGLNNPNIIPLDIARYSHVRPRTSYVAGHLSALGYYMMAYDIARYISWYMDQHKRDFRFIQFIGSPDAVYDYD